jgi:hypothetical protein
MYQTLEGTSRDSPAILCRQVLIRELSERRRGTQPTPLYARTITRMPAFMAVGSPGHASTTAAHSESNGAFVRRVRRILRRFAPHDLNFRMNSETFLIQSRHFSAIRFVIGISCLSKLSLNGSLRSWADVRR